jgi:hypothetical protein
MNNYLRSFCLFILIGLGSCSKSGDLKVSVKDSESEYRFSANYDRSKTIAAQQTINRAVKPNRIFADHDDHVDKEIKLVDGTTFYLNSAPGNMEITFDKRTNNVHSYEMIKKLGESVREVVTSEN